MFFKMFGPLEMSWSRACLILGLSKLITFERDGLAELAELGNSSLLGATAAGWEIGARLSSTSIILPLVGNAGRLDSVSPDPSVIVTHILNLISQNTNNITTTITTTNSCSFSFNYLYS